jgi:hypothetical protein
MQVEMQFENTHETENYFGACPECHKTDGYVDVVHDWCASHYFLCEEHKTRWFIGQNLFSSWMDEDPLQRQRHLDKMDFDSYREVKPWFSPQQLEEWRLALENEVPSSASDTAPPRHSAFGAEWRGSGCHRSGLWHGVCMADQSESDALRRSRPVSPRQGIWNWHVGRCDRMLVGVGVRLHLTEQDATQAMLGRCKAPSARALIFSAHVR